ncbi:hypothetical protein B0H12DRAFT_1088899 [Mycena haematopus]|nr:hypothetical protein B0H12DRAFT_1088899 [Mycena haematopus]
MSVVAATDAEEPHQILNNAAVAESNGNSSDIETVAKEFVPSNTKGDTSLEYGAGDASNTTHGNVDEIQSFVELPNKSILTIRETDPEPSTNVSSLEHATAEVAFATPENRDEVNALETNSAPPSSLAVPILDEDASTISRETRPFINDPNHSVADVMTVEEKTPETGFLPSMTDVPVLNGKDAPTITAEAQPLINDVVPVPVEDIAPVDAAEFASVKTPAEDILSDTNVDANRQPIAASEIIISHAEGQADGSMEGDDEAIGSFIPQLVETPSLKEESTDNAGLSAARESEIERPKSPWTPSYTVTTQGPGISAADEQELAELPVLPPSVNAGTVPVAQTETIVTITGTEGAEAEAPSPDVLRPWTPSYFVVVQGSPVEFDQEESKVDAADIDEQRLVQNGEHEAAKPDIEENHTVTSLVAVALVDPSTLQDPDIESDSPDPGSEAVIAALIESDVLDQAQEDVERVEALVVSVPVPEDASPEETQNQGSELLSSPGEAENVAFDQVQTTEKLLSADQSEPQRPRSPWTPSYSVNRQGSISAESQPEVASYQETYPSEHDNFVKPTADMSVLEAPIDAPRASSPWTHSYSVSRQGSPLPDSGDSGIESAGFTDEFVVVASVEAAAASTQSILQQTVTLEAPVDPPRPWTPSYSVSRQGSMSTGLQDAGIEADEATAEELATGPIVIQAELEQTAPEGAILATEQVEEEHASLEAERFAVEEAERERIAAEVEQARLEEEERLAQQKAKEEERARLKAERIAAEEAALAKQKAEEEERARIEAERLAAEAERARLEEERLARQKAEEEERARLEAERIAAEEAALAKQKAEEEERARIEAERIAAEEAERERVAAEEAEQARLERERLEEEERLAKQKADEEVRARLEAERIAAEEAERARIAAEEAERVRLEEERLAEERRAQEEAERLAAEQALLAQQKAEEEERARLEAECIAAEEAVLAKQKADEERALLEAERLAAEEAEWERIAAEAELVRLEEERLVKQKAEEEERVRLEAERIAAEEAALAKQKAEEQERERIAAEEAERDRLAEAERAHQAATKAEQDRLEKEHLETAAAASHAFDTHSVPVPNQEVPHSEPIVWNMANLAPQSADAAQVNSGASEWVEDPVGTKLTEQPTADSSFISDAETLVIHIPSTKEQQDASRLLAEHESDIERPKSPCTPSYSVTTQGPGIPALDDAELPSLPPSINAATVTDTQDVDAKVADIPRPWTPSYSVVVQGSPRIEAVANHANTTIEDVSIAIDTSEISAPANEEITVPSVLPADSRQQTFPLMLDVSNTSTDDVDEEPLSPPISPRSRLESTASSIRFPGGWFSLAAGRASFDVAQGEFSHSKPSLSSVPSLGAEQEQHVETEQSEDKKGKWCVVM